MVRPGRLLAAAGAVLVLLPAAAADARTKPPRLTAVRCVPATSDACRGGVKVTVGQQIQLRGTGLKVNLRVSFRWSRGALATKLGHSRVGYTARVPAGTSAGPVSVTVRDRAGRRSNARTITVAPKPTPTAPAVKPPAATAPSGLADAFKGDGMWIWYLSRSEGGDLAALIARAKATGIRTLFIKGADGFNVWPQLNTTVVKRLKGAGLNVCSWQFVYGESPAGEAAAAAASIATGVDCFVIDAETRYEGRYGAAQRYMTALRAAIGESFPLGLTSFPYVDYHPGLPYSVFLGPGGAQANLPQVYWKDIGGSVDAVSSRTFTHNRIYAVPQAPIGQTYGSAPAQDLRRFRAVWAAYGAAGTSWWDWQNTTNALWATLAEPAPAGAVLADPGWPALRNGSKGDQVIWLQQHLASVDKSVPITGTFAASTLKGLKAFQLSRGLPATGVTDAPTWQAILTLPVTPKDWVANAASRSARAASRQTGMDAAPASARLPARRNEVPVLGRG